MSRRIFLSLIAGIGIAALPIGVNADGGNATTQPAANDATPATQPAADATTQPAGNIQIIQQVVPGRNGFTIRTTGGMSAGPGQVKDIHTSFTVTAVGGNIVVQQGANANPPATQPADDATPPATQPAGNGG